MTSASLNTKLGGVACAINILSHCIMAAMCSLELIYGDLAFIFLYALAASILRRDTIPLQVIVVCIFSFMFNLIRLVFMIGVDRDKIMFLLFAFIFNTIIIFTIIVIMIRAAALPPPPPIVPHPICVNPLNINTMQFEDNDDDDEESCRKDNSCTYGMSRSEPPLQCSAVVLSSDTN